jgi:hypothetical protein
MENASLKLHGLLFSANISVTISLTKWIRHVASATEKRKHTKFLFEKPDGKDVARKT